MQQLICKAGKMEGVEMPELELPGFRFHPTEQELLGFYLKNMMTGKRECFDVIGLLNIYHHDPWELPGLARNGEREWYFFVPRDKKLGRDGRPNRTTEKGFWKATGSDRRIYETVDRGRLIIGLRKTLVFYEGRAPQGKKTDWIMSEYRLPDDSPLPKEMVLCKIYRKATSLKVMEQRAAVEEGSRLNKPPHLGTSALRSHQYYSSDFEKEPEEKKLKLAVDGETAEGFRLQWSSSSSSSFSSSSSCSMGSGQVPFVGEGLTELETPWFTVDWTQDSFWSRNSSPWLQTNAMNFKS